MTFMMSNIGAVAGSAQAQRGMRKPELGIVVPGIPTTFDGLYAPGHTLPNNQNLVARPTVSRPASKASNIATPSYYEPNTGVAVFRASAVADITDATPWYNRHEYSRRNAFNCDGTRFITQVLSGHWALYEVATFTRVSGGRTQSPGNGALGLPDNTWWFTGDCEPIWHPTNPDKIWVTGQNGLGGTFWEFDVVTKTRTVLFSLLSRIQALPGFSTTQFVGFMGEGRPSNDGTKWAFGCQDGASEFTGVVFYNRTTDTITGNLPTTNKPNNVSTSRSGNYCTVSWANGNDLTLTACRNAAVGATNGTRAYTPDFGSFQQLSYYGEHADEALDADGNDIYVSVSFNSTKMEDVSGGFIYHKRMSNGAATEYFRGDQGNSGAWHFSGHCSEKRPGQVLISKYVGSTVSNWTDLQMMFLKCQSSGALELKRLGSHQSLYSSAQGDSYWTEPHATVNSDGTQLMFNSNYQNASGPSESNMIALASWHLN